MRYNNQFLKQQDSKRLLPVCALALSCLTTFLSDNTTRRPIDYQSMDANNRYFVK